MSNLVQFNSQNLKLINYANQLWFTSIDIAKALNYSDSNAITLLFSKHKAEFDEEMSQTIETIGSGNLKRKQRIFNREGAWLIGMFARTPKAAEFRRWVLKVLGAVADNKPVEVKEHSRSLASGKKEIVLSAKDKENIGSIAKAVVSQILDEKLPPYLLKCHKSTGAAAGVAFRQTAKEIKAKNAAKLKNYCLTPAEADIIEIGRAHV